MEIFPLKIFGSLALLVFCSMLIYLFNLVWLKPEKIREKLRKRGIKGPKPSFLYGNVLEMKKIQSSVLMKATATQGDLAAHDYTSTLFPFFDQWRKQYGPIYMYSTGNRQHLYMNHPDLVKEINLCTAWDIGKPLYLAKELGPLLGNGILRSNGHVWAHQRNIIAPEFYMDKVKGMVGLMVESALPLLKTWKKRIEMERGIADIRVDDDLRNFSADVISRACFGSSYFKGKEIFSKLKALQNIMSKKGFLFEVSTLRILPTKKNREIWRLEREVKLLILKLVKEREEESVVTSNKDLLQMILESASSSSRLCPDESKSFIIDNCKNIYFAGHETTAITASWCLMLLALYPEWQARVRAEVLQFCGPDRFPDSGTLPKMKTVMMVIQETLRLYSPAPFVSREVLGDTKIGDFVVPKGIHLWTLISTLHRDPDIWGPDADEFKPERFADGISAACKLPQGYVPFGVGPRLCLGRNFAIAELKIILSLIISNFSFSLSPKYQHSPAYRMLVEPGYGVQLLVTKFD